MTIKTRTVNITTLGANGSAVGSGKTPYMSGKLLDIYLNFHADAPVTTHVTITHEDAFRGNILAVADTKTDALYAPRIATHKTDGTATGAYDQIALAGAANISVINCDALTNALVVTFTYET